MVLIKEANMELKRVERNTCFKCKYRDEGFGKPRTEGTVGCSKWHIIVDGNDVCSDYSKEDK